MTYAGSEAILQRTGRFVPFTGDPSKWHVSFHRDCVEKIVHEPYNEYVLSLSEIQLISAFKTSILTAPYEIRNMQFIVACYILWDIFVCEIGNNANPSLMCKLLFNRDNIVNIYNKIFKKNENVNVLGADFFVFWLENVQFSLAICEMLR